MVTNPQKGDKVWTAKKNPPFEVEIIRVLDDKISFYHDGFEFTAPIKDFFPSLDALLSDLRERAVPLEGGTK